MNTNCIFLIGHRGVGKTSLLRRCKQYLGEPWQAVCLDNYIEVSLGKSIDDLFAKGEEFFRNIEKKALGELLKTTKKPLVVAVGAGYIGEFPENSRIIFVKRKVDTQKFYFNNRPMLEKESLLISQERYLEREKHYLSKCSSILEIEEGDFGLSFGEREFFRESLNLNAHITLLPRLFKHGLSQHIENYKSYGLALEVRDDLLLSKDYKKLDYELFSFRDAKRTEESLLHANPTKYFDWPEELGPVPEELLNGLQDRELIHSSHTEAHDINEYLKRDFKPNTIYKWSPVIENFSQLEKALRWQLQDPECRNLLPRSHDGRWYWVRLLLKNQKINFVRESDGSAPDQPTFLDWASHEEGASQFAAVIGTDIKHSWSPNFHRDFFSERSANVFRIECKEKLAKVLPLLYDLGLRWLMVTAPFKTEAAELLSENLFDNSFEPAINTLINKEGRWQGRSTDDIGLQYLLKEIVEEKATQLKTVVWGGGGVLPSLKKVIPNATFYSHRSADPRLGERTCDSPEVLIWSVSKDGWEKKPQYPDFKSTPSLVIDLNYDQSSEGLAYAIRVGAEYKSGKEMFIRQAEAQQKFWERYE